MVSCKTGKRRPLIRRRRKLPAKMRRRRKYQDIPKQLDDVLPGSEEFEGRLMTEISGANGPKQVAAIVRQLGPELVPMHLAAALSQLAGFYAARAGGERLPRDKAALIAHSARLCCALLQRRVAECEPMHMAQSAYALGKLAVYDEVLLDSFVSGTLDRLHLLPPEGYAALISGLSACGHTPTKEWLDRFCLETYARMSRLNGRELAGCAYSLMRLGHRPSDAWLAGLQRAARGTFGTSSNAPALAKLVYAMAKLQARPSFNWMSAFMSEARAKLDMMTGRELVVVLWSVAQLQHSPDPLYMEGWFRCTARRMESLSLADVQLVLTALVPLSRGRPAPLKFAGALLPRLQALLPSCSGAQLSELLWGLVNLRLRPPAPWMDALMAELVAKLPSLTSSQLADSCWSLGRLRYQPPARQVQAITQRVGALLPSMRAIQLGLIIWGYQQMQCAVPDAWMQLLGQRAGQEGGLLPAGSSSSTLGPHQMVDLLERLAASNTAESRAAAATASSVSSGPPAARQDNPSGRVARASRSALDVIKAAAAATALPAPAPRRGRP